jgi:hypothetical protein
MDDELLDGVGDLLADLDLDLDMDGLEATTSLFTESTDLFSLDLSGLELDTDGGLDFLSELSVDGGSLDLEPGFAELTPGELAPGDLEVADLAGVDLAGADLAGADLAGVDLAGVDLAGGEDGGLDAVFGADAADTDGLDLDGAEGLDLDGADPHDLDAGGAGLDAPEDAELGAGAAGTAFAEHAEVIPTQGEYAPEEGFFVSHGDPAGAMATCHAQEAENSCAIACQRDIIHAMTERDVSETSLAECAEKCSWYTPGDGTPLNHIGDLLERNGIPCERGLGAEIADLQTWLNEGRGIIVGIDSADLNPDCRLDELWDTLEAGHAVRVTGIETNPLTEEQLIVLNDPGAPGLAGLKVPASIFMDAWQDTAQFACVTAPHA